jgi:hypothetical protein
VIYVVNGTPKRRVREIGEYDRPDTNKPSQLTKKRDHVTPQNTTKHIIRMSGGSCQQFGTRYYCVSPLSISYYSSGSEEKKEYQAHPAIGQAAYMDA